MTRRTLIAITVLLLATWLVGSVGHKYLARIEQSVQSESTSPESASAWIARSLNEARQNFRLVFPTLMKPAANERWYRLEAIRLDDKTENENWLLVTPFGPCANMIGGVGGYSVITMHVGIHNAEPSELIGNFPDKDRASSAAVTYCVKWYSSRNESILDPEWSWFSPDEHLKDQGPADAGLTQAKAETSAELASGSTSAESDAAPPIPNLKMELQPNGDERFVIGSLTCATIGSRMRGSFQKAHLTLSDGTDTDYDLESMSAVIEEARAFCLALPRK